MKSARRNRAALERAVTGATTDRRRAAALYQLAVFHDNNGRERLAIPSYRRALKLGLDRAAELRAAAWLASSLYKTGLPVAAMRWARHALASPQCPAELKRFLLGLQKRIRR